MPLRSLILVSVLTFASGCAATAHSDPDRAYHREDFRLRFIEERRQCVAAGGRMHLSVQGTGLDRDGVPRTRVPYYCG